MPSCVAEARLQTKSAVRLHALSGTQPTLLAEVLGHEADCYRLRVSEAVVPGMAVRLDTEENLWLGEVSYCQPELKGYLLGVHVEHVLVGPARLAAALAEKSWLSSDGSGCRQIAEA